MNFRIFFILFSFLLQSNLGSAHKANEAFFMIQQVDDGFMVEAEFPWTLRTALLEYNPALEEAKDKAAFEKTFLEYMRDNLILLNEHGNQLKLHHFKELPNNGHSHQGTYQIFYKGATLGGIKNTAQFNLYPNQVNFNRVRYNNKEYEFESTFAVPSFQLTDNLVRSNIWLNIYMTISIILIMLLLVFLTKKIKPKS